MYRYIFDQDKLKEVVRRKRRREELDIYEEVMRGIQVIGFYSSHR